jgi:catechol 2,3-dioxygenase-like lactoylglutathione lyase family enzyme
MLKRILHTGVAVESLDKTLALYESLGFEIANRFEKPEPRAQVATVKKGDTAFELWQFEDTAHPQVPFISNHVAIYSDDLENDVADFVRQGYTLVIPMTEGVVLRYAFVQDAAGMCYEIATEKTTVNKQ